MRSRHRHVHDRRARPFNRKCPRVPWRRRQQCSRPFPQRSLPFPFSPRLHLPVRRARPRNAREQDHTSPRHQDGAGQSQGAERQCKDGPPSQALSASSPSQAHRPAQDACETRRGQACDADCETRLNLIRWRMLRPHCPPRLRMTDQPMCQLNGRGLARAQLFESEVRQ